MTDNTRRSVALAELRDAPDNLRGKIDGNLIAELARSIESQGLISPPLVRPVEQSDEHDATYEIVAGHRRVAAARKLGWDVIPVEVRTLSDADRTQLMLIENMQRVDLTPIEEAHGYFRLIEGGMTVKELAKKVGRTQKHVSARLKLIELPGWLQDLVDDGTASLEDAETFAKLYAEHRDWLDSKEAEERQALADEMEQKFVGRGARWAAQHLESLRKQERRDEAVQKVRDLTERHGFTFVEQERDAYGQAKWPKGHAPLDQLNIEAKEHRKEPCHGIGVVADYKGPRKVEMCTQRGRHTAKGKSEVKPVDIDAQQARRAEDKARREEAREQERRQQEAIGAAVSEAKSSQLHDVVVRWTCEWALNSNDSTTTEIVDILGLDRSEARSAPDRARLLEEHVASASKAALGRLAAVTTFVKGAGVWQDPVGRKAAQEELVAPYVDGE